MLDIAPDGLSRWLVWLQAWDLTGGSSVPLGLQLSLLVMSFLGVAFFTSAEAALVAVNKIRIQFLDGEGNAAAGVVNRVLAQHEKFFATILLSQNAFTIAATAIGTALMAERLQNAGYAAVLTTVIMTVTISIFGEITPKTLAATYSERWSLVAGRPVAFVMLVCAPFIYLFTALPRLMYKVMGTSPDRWQTGLTEGELRLMIDLSRQQGAVESDEAERLHRVFDFGDRRVGEIMTPRTEIVWVEKGATMRQFLALYAENSHTRFPVFEGTRETVMGVLSNKEVLIALAQGRTGLDDAVTDTMRPVDFIPETVTVSDTFNTMQDQRLSMMLVTNEYGGIAGLVTLKQIIGVIVGIVVEDDPPSAEADRIIVPLEDGAYVMGGGLTIMEINDRLEDAGITVPEGEYQTIVGLVLHELGELPREGEPVRVGDDLVVTVTDMAGGRVNQVRLEVVYPIEIGGNTYEA